MGKFTLSYYVSLRSEFPDEISITISALRGCSVRTLPQVSCRREHVLFTLFVFCVYWCQTHVFVFVRIVYTMLPLSLDCPFITPSVFSNVCGFCHAQATGKYV